MSTETQDHQECVISRQPPTDRQGLAAIVALYGPDARAKRYRSDDIEDSLNRCSDGHKNSNEVNYVNQQNNTKNSTK